MIESKKVDICRIAVLIFAVWSPAVYASSRLRAHEINPAFNSPDASPQTDAEWFPLQPGGHQSGRTDQNIAHKRKLTAIIGEKDWRDSHDHPATCRVTITWPEPKLTSVCTGWLAADCVLVTSGHCIRNVAGNQTATGVQVYCADSGNTCGDPLRLSPSRANGTIWHMPQGYGNYVCLLFWDGSISFEVCTNQKVYPRHTRCMPNFSLDVVSLTCRSRVQDF